MISRTLQEIFVVFASIFAAFGLSLLPLPRLTFPFMPDWVLLVVLYWVIFLPQGVSIGIAWITGLLIDVLTNSLLGEHAVASAFVAYLGLKLYRRIRVFPLWQQMLSILVLLSIYHAILFWIQGIIQQPLTPNYWFAIITGTLVWPLIATLLHDSQRRPGEL